MREFLNRAPERLSSLDRSQQRRETRVQGGCVHGVGAGGRRRSPVMRARVRRGARGLQGDPASGYAQLCVCCRPLPLRRTLCGLLLTRSVSQ